MNRKYFVNCEHYIDGIMAYQLVISYENKHNVLEALIICRKKNNLGLIGHNIITKRYYFIKRTILTFLILVIFILEVQLCE